MQIKQLCFIRFCDSFNIPLVTFEDMPGYLPGAIKNMQELYVMEPRFVCLFRSYGCQNHCYFKKSLWRWLYCHEFTPFGADFVFALPSAEIVMGPEGAILSLLKKKKLQIKMPCGAEKVKRICRKFANPFVAASKRVTLMLWIEPDRLVVLFTSYLFWYQKIK